MALGVAILMILSGVPVIGFLAKLGAVAIGIGGLHHAGIGVAGGDSHARHNRATGVGYHAGNSAARGRRRG